MTADERRRAILEELCARRYETRENLAFEFGVSIRTIDYDVMHLSQEYPIYTAQGNGGGIHVMEGFYVNRTTLTDKQAALLRRLEKKLTGEEKRLMDSILKTFGNKRRS